MLRFPDLRFRMTTFTGQEAIYVSQTFFVMMPGEPHTNRSRVRLTVEEILDISGSRLQFDDLGRLEKALYPARYQPVFGFKAHTVKFRPRLVTTNWPDVFTLDAWLVYMKAHARGMLPARVPPEVTP